MGLGESMNDHDNIMHDEDGVYYVTGRITIGDPGVEPDFVQEGSMKWEPRAAMVTVRGRPFRCDCGANVLTEYEYHKYRCNGCRTEYEGS